MNVFGPFYPIDLQRSVNHAEHLASAVARTLSDLPRHRDGTRRGREARAEARSEAETWLLGRADEIELFVGEIVADWRVGLLGARQAAAVVERYLFDLHRAYVAVAGDGGAPSCCRGCAETADVDPDELAMKLAAS